MCTNKKGYMAKYVMKRRNEIIEALGGKCVACETKYNLEIHHVTGYTGPKSHGRGSLTRLMDWQDNLDDLELLCSECHNFYHSTMGLK